MKRPLPVVAALLAATLLIGSNVHAQARGPSAGEVLENGQELPDQLSFGEKLRQAVGPDVARALDLSYQLPAGAEANEPDERLDDATHARKLAELKVWLPRLQGRFRIDGLIEHEDYATVEGGMPGMPPVRGIGVKLTGEISGVADCNGIGEGLGVQCIINATWPVIDRTVADPGALNAKESAPERIKTLRPAVLVLGLNRSPLGVRFLLVSADSIADGWVGKLEENTVKGTRLTGCEIFKRCHESIQIIAEPEGEIVTLLIKSFAEIDIRLDMHRDPEARAEKPLKSMKAR